jgi:hypothetical protein
MLVKQTEMKRHLHDNIQTESNFSNFEDSSTLPIQPPRLPEVKVRQKRYLIKGTKTNNKLQDGLLVKVAARRNENEQEYARKIEGLNILPRLNFQTLKLDESAGQENNQSKVSYKKFKINHKYQSKSMIKIDDDRKARALTGRKTNE